MDNQAPKVTTPRTLALRFISGKYQGGELELTDRKEIVVGRSSDLDMVLVEDMVSRKHARIECNGPSITIEDLGSTNGTFVNGEKIKRSSLKEGDRVLIGTSILKVVAIEPGTAGMKRPTADPSMGSTRSMQTKSMSGQIDEIPLPDLLQLFGSSKKSGVLVVRTPEGETGKIFLRKGLVYFASVNDVEDAPPLKSAYRILTWMQGSFDLDAPDERTIPGEVNVSVQELLMEGLRQIDEYNNMKDRLPAPTSRLSVQLPLKPALKSLAPNELDVFQAVLNHGVTSQVMARSPLSDLDTGEAILKLLAGGYIRSE